MLFFNFFLICDWMRGSNLMGTTEMMWSPSGLLRHVIHYVRWNDDCVRHDDGKRRKQLSFVCVFVCLFLSFSSSTLRVFYSCVIVCTLYSLRQHFPPSFSRLITKVLFLMRLRINQSLNFTLVTTYQKNFTLVTVNLY